MDAVGVADDHTQGHGDTAFPDGMEDGSGAHCQGSDCDDIEEEMVDVDITDGLNLETDFPNEVGEFVEGVHPAREPARLRLPPEPRDVRNHCGGCADIRGCRDAWCTLLPLLTVIITTALTAQKIASNDHYLVSNGTALLAFTSPVSMQEYLGGGPASHLAGFVTESGELPSSLHRRVELNGKCFYLEDVNPDLFRGTLLRGFCDEENVYIARPFAHRDLGPCLDDETPSVTKADATALRIPKDDLRTASRLSPLSFSYSTPMHQKVSVLEAACDHDYLYMKPYHGHTLLLMVLAPLSLCFLLVAFLRFGGGGAVGLGGFLAGLLLICATLAAKFWHIYMESSFPFIAGAVLAAVFALNNCGELGFAGAMLSMSSRILLHNWGVFPVLMALAALLWLATLCTAILLGSLDGAVPPGERVVPVCLFLFHASLLSSVAMYLGAGLGSEWVYADSKARKAAGDGARRGTCAFLYHALTTNLGSIAFAAAATPIAAPLLWVSLEMDPLKPRRCCSRIHTVLLHVLEAVVRRASVYSFAGMARSQRPFLNASGDAFALIRKNNPRGWRAVMGAVLWYPLCLLLLFNAGLLGAAVAFGRSLEPRHEFRWMVAGFFVGAAACSLVVSALYGCALSIFVGFWRFRPLGIKWKQPEVPKGPDVNTPIQLIYLASRSVPAVDTDA